MSLNDSLPRICSKFLSLSEACDSRYRVILLFNSMSSVGDSIAYSPNSNYAVEIVFKFIGAGSLSFKLDVTIVILFSSCDSFESMIGVGRSFCEVQTDL